MEKRTRRLHILLSAKDKKMLCELAELRGLSKSDLIRQLIRERIAAEKVAGDRAVQN